LRCSNFSGGPLLTGNGIPAGFSVLVPLEYGSGAGCSAALQKSRGRKHA
jgi:hypothetical protein